jgi:hypothetical protein
MSFKKVAFLSGTANLDIHDLAKELAKSAKIDVYLNKQSGYVEERDHVTYKSRAEYDTKDYDYNIVVDGLAPFLDNYMENDIYVWLKSSVNIAWNGVKIGQALIYNIQPLVTSWITSFDTKGLDNVVDLKGADDWKNLLGLNFEMKYKDVVRKEIPKSQNSSYFLHPSKLLGDTEI